MKEDENEQKAFCLNSLESDRYGVVSGLWSYTGTTPYGSATPTY